MEKKIILLVEADILIRHPLAEYLRGCDYLVIEAIDAQEARLVIDKGERSVDVALLDISEETGRNFALAGWMRENRPEIEVLRAEGAIGDTDKYPRWNVIARAPGKSAGDTVHFNSHHDVVETGSGWTTDPFGGEVKDGKVYGRGSCDMKGGLAASIIAAEAFIDTHPDFAGAIEISATADEESGGFAGVAWLAEQGRFSPDRVQHVIIPEPLNKNRICLGHRGVWWAEIETLGRIAHGSMPFLGDSAIRHMAALLGEIEETLYPVLATRETAMPVASTVFFAVPGATMNIAAAAE